MSMHSSYALHCACVVPATVLDTVAVGTFGFSAAQQFGLDLATTRAAANWAGLRATPSVSL